MLSELQKKILYINCLTEKIDSLYHQAGLKLGVSDSVLQVLYMVYTSGGKCALYDIYRSYNVSKQTINSAVRKLESDDIIRLEKLDGKAKEVCFTEKGMIYAERNAAKLFDAECRVFNGWSKEEIQLYIDLIEKYNDEFQKQIQDL